MPCSIPIRPGTEPRAMAHTAPHAPNTRTCPSSLPSSPEQSCPPRYTVRQNTSWWALSVARGPSPIPGTSPANTDLPDRIGWGSFSARIRVWDTFGIAHPEAPQHWKGTRGLLRMIQVDFIDNLREQLGSDSRHFWIVILFTFNSWSRDFVCQMTRREFYVR